MCKCIHGIITHERCNQAQQVFCEPMLPELDIWSFISFSEWNLLAGISQVLTSQGHQGSFNFPGQENMRSERELRKTQMSAENYTSGERAAASYTPLTASATATCMAPLAKTWPAYILIFFFLSNRVTGHKRFTGDYQKIVSNDFIIKS